MKVFICDDCKVCGQGLLIACRKYIGGDLFVYCDECELAWSGPSVSKTSSTAIDVAGVRFQFASQDDIVNGGWDLSRFYEGEIG